MIGEKSRYSEKYPQVAKLLVAEFNVRQAAGCKVSKLLNSSFATT